MRPYLAIDILSSDGIHQDRAKAASAGIISAAGDLAPRITAMVVEQYGRRMPITSGYRTPEANKKAGGAPKSSHLEGMAVDLADPKGDLAKWILANQDELETNGLWMEDPASTKGWVHLQSRPVTGKRIFKP